MEEALEPRERGCPSSLLTAHWEGSLLEKTDLWAVKNRGNALFNQRGKSSREKGRAYCLFSNEDREEKRGSPVKRPVRGGKRWKVPCEPSHFLDGPRREKEKISAGGRRKKKEFGVYHLSLALGKGKRSVVRKGGEKWQISSTLFLGRLKREGIKRGSSSCDRGKKGPSLCSRIVLMRAKSFGTRRGARKGGLGRKKKKRRKSPGVFRLTARSGDWLSNAEKKKKKKKRRGVPDQRTRGNKTLSTREKRKMVSPAGEQPFFGGREAPFAPPRCPLMILRLKKRGPRLGVKGNCV